jgi:uncharacterized protein YdaU (DUF1376 family)
MHYYKRNLGDYAKKAGRLSMLQHGSYTLLIDACYDREQFPTREEAIDWTWASSTEEIEAVDFVLSKFFVLEDGHYVQTRIREELIEYQEKSNTNKRIANEREANRIKNNTKRARTVNEPLPKQHESPPNQEPLTINQLNSKDGGNPPPTNSTPENQGETTEPEFDTVAFIFDAGLKLLGAKNRALIGKARKQVGDQKTTEILASMAAMRPPVSEPVAYFMAAITPKLRELVL